MILAEIGYDEMKYDDCITSIKLCNHKDISKIIDCLNQMYAYLYDTTPSSINSGLCEEFACDICEILGEGQEFWDSDYINDELNLDFEDAIDAVESCHCFVKYNDKFYDSECPYGVDHWSKLPIYSRNTRIVEMYKNLISIKKELL